MVPDDGTESNFVFVSHKFPAELGRLPKAVADPRFPVGGVNLRVGGTFTPEAVPIGESNPGLPHNRKGYLPVHYRAFLHVPMECKLTEIFFCHMVRSYCIHDRKIATAYKKLPQLLITLVAPHASHGDSGAVQFSGAEFPPAPQGSTEVIAFSCESES